MTKDDIMRMAREAGFNASNGFSALIVRHSNGSWIDVADDLDRFANLVAAHKAEVALAEAYRCGYKDGMEAAAVICENVAWKYQHAHNASSENIADECADAIRARGTT
jgi:hypothetical protein